MPEGFEVRAAFPDLEEKILMWRLMDIRTTPVPVCTYTKKPKEIDVRRAIQNYTEWGGDDNR